MPTQKELTPHATDLKRRNVPHLFYHPIPSKKHDSYENFEFFDTLPGLTEKQKKILRKRRCG